MRRYQVGIQLAALAVGSLWGFHALCDWWDAKDRAIMPCVRITLVTKDQRDYVRCVRDDSYVPEDLYIAGPRHDGMTLDQVSDWMFGRNGPIDDGPMNDGRDDRDKQPLPHARVYALAERTRRTGALLTDYGRLRVTTPRNMFGQPYIHVELVVPARYSSDITHTADLHE